MKNQVALQLVVIAGLGLAAQANAYQAEVNGSYQNVDNNVQDVDTYQVGGEFYLNGVQSNSGPFVESAFLSQATSFRGTYQDNDTANVDGIILGGRFVDKNSGMLFSADVATGDLDGLNVGVGLYLDSHSTITASYIEQNDFVDGYGIEYKNLLSQNNGTYINLEAGATYLETTANTDVTTWSVAGDYFFDKTISLGLGVDVATGDTDSTTFGLNGSMFLAQNITIEASLAQTDTDGISEDDTSLKLGGKVRF